MSSHKSIFDSQLYLIFFIRVSPKLVRMKKKETHFHIYFLYSAYSTYNECNLRLEMTIFLIRRLLVKCFCGKYVHIKIFQKLLT